MVVSHPMAGCPTVRRRCMHTPAGSIPARRFTLHPRTSESFSVFPLVELRRGAAQSTIRSAHFWDSRGGVLCFTSLSCSQLTVHEQCKWVVGNILACGACTLHICALAPFGGATINDDTHSHHTSSQRYCSRRHYFTTPNDFLLTFAARHSTFATMKLNLYTVSCDDDYSFGRMVIAAKSTRQAAALARASWKKYCYPLKYKLNTPVIVDGAQVVCDSARVIDNSIYVD